MVGLSGDVVSITFSPGAVPGSLGVVFVEKQHLPPFVDGMNADDLVNAGGPHVVIVMSRPNNLDALIECLVSLRQQMQASDKGDNGAEAKA